MDQKVIWYESDLKQFSSCKIKLGIFGGSFDPVHNGHLHLVQNALHILSLDEVWFDVVVQNPEKPKHKYSFEDRIKKIGALILDDKKCRILAIERQLQITDTADLIDYLAIQLPNAELYFLAGADIAESIGTWPGFERILKQAKIIFFSRPKYSCNAKESILLSDYPNQVLFFEIDEIDISSSEIRKNLSTSDPNK